MDYLQSSNIDSRPLFYPIHKMPPYFLNRTLPNSETLSKQGLSLPSYYQLKKKRCRLYM